MKSVRTEAYLKEVGRIAGEVLERLVDFVAATFSLHIAEASLLSDGLSDFPKLSLMSDEKLVFREYTNSVRSKIKSTIRFCGLLIKTQTLVTPNKTILTLI